jgi:hypothetical protein
MLTKDAYIHRERLPLVTACIEMVLISAAIGLIGYALLPVIGY